MIHNSLGILGVIGVLLLGALLAIVTSIVAKIGGDEVSGFLPVWSNHFLERAVSRVPEQHQERYRAEWKAELAQFEDRKLSGLLFAWRLSRKARSVGAALGEGDVLDPGSEPDPLSAPGVALDSATVAEIVRRAVERTRPENQFTFEEIIEEMRSIVSGVAGVGDVATLTDLYVEEISERRRQARIRPTLPAMSPHPPLPTWRPQMRRGDETETSVAFRDFFGGRSGPDWQFPDDGQQPAAMSRALTRRNKTFLQKVVLTAKEWSRGEIWL